MSHKASHWLADISAHLINAGSFRVLFHLCDAHNSKRPPESACYPSQEFLREATGLSNGGLNNAINALENAGLLRRRRTRNRDGTRGPTYYILGCDNPEAQQTPESGDGSKREHSVDKPVDKPVDKCASNSKLEGKPTPNSGTNQLHSTGDKPVKEPVKEPRRRNRLFGTAELIRSHKPFLCRSIKPSAAQECIEAGLVSIEDCRASGIPM